MTSGVALALHVVIVVSQLRYLRKGFHSRTGFHDHPRSHGLRMRRRGAGAQDSRGELTVVGQRPQHVNGHPRRG
jgi:hypothetical protein